MKMQLLSIHIILCLLLPAVIGCAHNSGKALKVNASNNSQNETGVDKQPSTSEVKKLFREGGWEIPGLDNSNVLTPRDLVRDNSGSTPIYRTIFQPNSQSGQAFKIKEDYFSANERKTLNLLPGKYVVMRIIEFDVGEHKFCYIVWVHPDGIGAINGFHYYDDDGDGKFERLERGTIAPAFIPSIPQWLLNKVGND